MFKRKIGAVAIIGVLFVASFAGCSGNKETVKINADGTKVSVGTDGVNINSYGTKVDVGTDGVNIDSDGTKVNVGTDGVSVDSNGKKFDLDVESESDDSDSLGSILSSALDTVGQVVEADIKNTKGTPESSMKDGLDLSQISQYYRKDIVPLYEGSKILQSECDKSSCDVTLVTEKSIKDVKNYYSNALKSVEGVYMESTENLFTALGKKDKLSFILKVEKINNGTLINISIE
ncbi:hypothetical protein [Acetivibrio cellulolyticus]|uniref:hypothetical protein n=1 Tax=Acetivibrio cellulolyticus TaxID=35830 RepID=UPI0001E2D4EE|nr:hypothetical protein [Acetivibrio cellulolyticus]